MKKNIYYFLVPVLASILGLADSLYLTIAHYSHTQLVCANNSFINCQSVTSSVYSFIPKTSVPVSLLGIIWFLISLIILFMAFKEMLKNIKSYYLYWTSFGLAFVIYLVYTEFFRLHKICEWCTLVHILVAVCFVSALLIVKANNIYSDNSDK